MLNDNPSNLAAGGACVWRLPTDTSGPAMARSMPQATMVRLGLNGEAIDNGKLAVSETATNALRHGQPESAQAAPELWIWARTMPAPQQVISVFDTATDKHPRPADADPLDEQGRGLGLLEAFTHGWGSAPSRSRQIRPGTPGKTVWFALPLPADRLNHAPEISPRSAALALQLNLGRRNITAVRRSDSNGISLLELPGINIWIDPQHYRWHAVDGRPVRHPLIDLQEATEHLVSHLDQQATARRPAETRTVRNRS